MKEPTVNMIQPKRLLGRLVMLLKPAKRFKTGLSCGYSSGKWRSYQIVYCPFCDEKFEFYYHSNDEQDCPKCGAVHTFKGRTAKAT